jgi:hypothetical protein
MDMVVPLNFLRFVVGDNCVAVFSVMLHEFGHHRPVLAV